MSYGLYQQLCYVKGFQEINGDTYSKYIVGVNNVDKFINNEIKNQILNATNIDDVFYILNSNNIQYSHDYDMCQN